MSEVKPITWSFSSLKAYQTCPRQFYSYKVAKQYQQEETEAIRYGKVLHEAFEFYIRDNKDLPQDFERFRSVLDALKNIPGDKYCEYEMALNNDLKPASGFLGKDVFCRGIADLLIVNGETAYVVDYKSGKAKYPDKKQLELMALMVFAYFPEVKLVKGMLLFVHYDVTVKGEYKRTQEKELWVKWLNNVEQLKTSHLTSSWPPNSSGLCRGWCMVEWCEHHQAKRN